jgi:aminopeptidase N
MVVASGEPDDGIVRHTLGEVAVVYGKAPGLYRALEERYGVDETTDALAAVVADHAFDPVAPDDLRAALGEALGDPASVDSLWNRWLEERHGDEDLSD